MTLDIEVPLLNYSIMYTDNGKGLRQNNFSISCNTCVVTYDVICNGQ